MRSLFLKQKFQILGLIALLGAVSAGAYAQNESDLSDPIETALRELNPLLDPSSPAKHPHEVCECVITCLKRDASVYQRYAVVCQSLEDLKKVQNARRFFDELQRVFEQLPPEARERVMARAAQIRPLAKMRIYTRVCKYFPN